MKQTNENCKTMDVISFADFCRCLQQAMAENPNITEEELNTLANDLVMTVPLLGDEEKAEREPQMFLELSEDEDEQDAVLDEVLASMGTLLKPTAQPTAAEVAADPDAFVILRREDLAPYFDEDTPAEVIDLMITTLLEADRIRNE